MTLFVLAYLGGVLTIVSPCILPVLPFVFSRGDRPFARSGLPILIGMVVTFALVASLAAVAGGWAVEANRYGRIAALILLAAFGVMLLFPGIAERATRPLVGLGARLSQSTEKGGGFGSSLLIGVATGLLWAPCAGPVLGLILTGAALQGANTGTTLLLLAYAAGAATALALALLVGGRVLHAMRRSLGGGEWVRRGLGAAVLVGVAAIALGLDTGLLTRLSSAGTVAIEERLIDALDPTEPVAMSAGTSMRGGSAMMQSAPTTSGPKMMAGPTMMSGSNTMAGPAMMTGPTMMVAGPRAAPAAGLPIEGSMPPLDGAVEWLNSPPLTADALRGKVVLVDFWTYSCINCLRAAPYVRAWAEKYKDQGLVVVGIHTPEFAFEKDIDNVRAAADDLGIAYPVAIDNDYAIWRAFSNRYWPAHYLIDAEGRIRHHTFGEGGYGDTERNIQALLAEAGSNSVASDIVTVSATGVEAASARTDVLSPETYVGYERAENFVSPGGAVRDAPNDYVAGDPRLNQWGLAGPWTVGGEQAVLDEADGAVVYRFHARDLHLVLGPGADGKPVRFRVTLDSAPPGEDHGVDVAEDGSGIVTGQRLYQLVRQAGPVRDRTFEIRFLDPGVEVYAFTFG